MTSQYGGAIFVLGTEVGCVYKQAGKDRCLHLPLLRSPLNLGELTVPARADLIAP